MKIMTDNYNNDLVLEAIRDAVESAVAEFGIEFVRTLSMFPSSVEAVELKKAAKPSHPLTVIRAA